jgi:hypothetical protein
LHKRLRFFTAFVAFEITQFLASIAMVLHSPFPRDAYWWTILVAGGVIESLLSLGVIYDLADELLLSRPTSGLFIRRFFSAALVLLLLLAAAFSGALHDISRHRALNVSELVDFSSGMVVAGLLLALFMFARALNFTWPRQAAGIALGLGIWSSVDVVGAALRSGFGYHSLVPVDILEMSAYHVSALVWFFYALPPFRPSRAVSTNVEHSDLEVWGQELRRMVQ